MEGDGDLMKMLMHADPPEENIQGSMEETGMVQSGAYPQTGIAYGSGHYAGMQQQLPAMNPQRPQQQQQRSSGFPSMNPGQMIPRSPNNGMMQPDMDLVLQQQQYQQQQSQQSAYGNGNYNQGFNGGYQNPRPVSPQTMSPYQAGFPSEPGYSSGTGGSQTMGEFGTQAGPNQTMGMPGPASLSLAAMSNRQQYYSDGYGMNPPVSPLHKQMPQGGGFLQPSGMPYSQQVQSYQSSSYPKRPPSSPVQTQMPGFSSGGSSYTPRSSAGMQLPNMPYQSSTNPYQPPHSPGRRSSTSPVPQQDTGMYSRPHEHYPQPRSPFGTSQVHFQQQQPQQQPQPQQHSSCMFVQPSTTPPQSHYQSQQLMAGTKAGGLTQRRSSYPGQQNTVKMPQSPPPHKRSPPSKIPSPNPKSPDLTRPGQLGFEERGPSTTKETASSPPCSDPSQGISETTGVVSSSVQCSFKKKATASKKIIKVEGHKGVPHQRRSTASPSSAESPSVSPPTVKKECMDGIRSKAEEMSGKQEESFKNNEGLVKIENVERKSKDPNGSNEISKVEVSSHSSKGQEGNKEERSLQSSADSKGKESCGSVGEERRQSEVNKPQPDKTAAVETTSQAPQTIVNTEEECKESEGTTANTGKPGSNAKMPIRESDKTKTSPRKKVECCEEDNMLSSKGSKIVKEGKDLPSSKNVDHKGEEMTSVMEHKSGKKEDKSTNPAKSVNDTSETSGETGKAGDKTSNTACETGKTGDSSGKSAIQSEKNVSKTGKTSQPIDGGGDKSGKEFGKSGKTGDETNPGASSEAVVSVDNTNTVCEDKKRNVNKADKIQTTAKEAKEPKETASKGNPASDEHEASNKTDEHKGSNKVSNVAKEKPHSQQAQEAAKGQKKKSNTAVPSLRCDERLSSDDDDRLLDKTSRNAESASVPVIERVTIESRTLGIQTTQQTTATARTAQQQATPIKATIIAKGKSSQNNQQVMVAKTTTGQMYLIQGNILVPVQKISSKDDASKQNPQLIVVKTASGQHGEHKLSATAAKGDNGKEASKERKDGKAQVGNSQRDKTSKVSDKERAAVASSSGYKKSDQIVKKSERSPNTKTAGKSDKSPSKMSPTQSGKETQSNKTDSPRGKHGPESKTPDKREEMPSPSQTAPDKLTRGRPTGSKDKQKRKSFVHKAKRTQDAMEVEVVNEQELEGKRKFSKTAIAVQEMSSPSAEATTTIKRPLEVPTVSASAPTKRRKISTSGSPVKHISTRPRGGIDGDSWVCSLCGKRSGSNLLGDLYGPYKTKFLKEKADSSSKEGKLSQKLSSPGRKSSSSSDVQADSESFDVDLWIHRDCGVWSPGVFMLGRTILGLEQAVESAAQHNCTKCSELGATLVCFKRGCNKMFHYACARDSGCSFIEDNFTIFCSTHK